MTNSFEQPGDNCLFCRKEIVGKSFFSSEQFSAFYNIAPILPGHSLVVPIAHYTSLLELSETELGDMMVFARKATKVLQEVFKCESFDWTLQDGISAGQTVPHLHLHIIPRKPFDLPEGNDWYGKIPQNELNMLDSQHRERLNEKEYTEITARLSEAAKLFTP
jgi:bis(5'-adenosyl)-triphosphatase